jgi:hypothetical protein
VVQILDNMIREKVKVENFKEIASKNEYFLWHFLMEEQNESTYALWSIFDQRYDTFINDFAPNPLNFLLSEINVPYFESYTKDSMDFLINLGIDGRILFNRSRNGVNRPKRMYYQPIIIGFKKTAQMWNTHKTCYCIEGITEVVLKMNPQLLSNIELE